MKNVILGLLGFTFSLPVTAEILESGERVIQTSIPYLVISVEARCDRPKWEDDAYKVFYSNESYRFLAPYFEKGYWAKLLDRTCGAWDSSTELSEENFEKVKILLLNNRDASEAVKNEVDDLIKKYQ